MHHADLPLHSHVNINQFNTETPEFLDAPILLLSSSNSTDRLFPDYVSVVRTPNDSSAALKGVPHVLTISLSA